MSELSEEYKRVCKELDEITALCESQKEEREQVNKRAEELNETIEETIEGKGTLEGIKTSIFNQWVQEEIINDNRDFATPLIRVIVKSEKGRSGDPEIYENWGFYRVGEHLIRVYFNDDNIPTTAMEQVENYDTYEPYFVSYTIEDFVKGKQIPNGGRDGILYSYLRHIMGKSNLSDYSYSPYIEIVVYDDTIKKWFPETPHENFYPEALCQDEPHPEFCNKENRKDEYKYFTIRWEN